tara:strand:+ start:87 stop:455 length:369 start_codon:yes stop_codon:yes gene_type:complete
MIEKTYGIPMTTETIARNIATKISTQNPEQAKRLQQVEMSKTAKQHKAGVKTFVKSAFVGPEGQRRLDFGSLQSHPQDIIDTSFDRDTYDSLIGEYLQRNDPIEMLRIIIDASIGIHCLNLL